MEPTRSFGGTIKDCKTCLTCSMAVSIWSEFDQVKIGVEDGLLQLAIWSMSYLLSNPFIGQLEQCFCHMESSYLGNFLDYRFGFLWFLVHCDNIDDFGMGRHFGGVGMGRAIR